MMFLEVDNLSKNFGGLQAVSDFSLRMEKGALHGLIGPNGAGKTTVFNLITGVYTPSSGKIVLDGQDLVGKHSHQITQAGIARTFQNIRLFGEMTVLDNIRVAFNYRLKYGFGDALLHPGTFRKEENRITQEAFELLQLFHLEGMAENLARNLPYGEQRRLEIARALATHPQILLLDEPAAGMNPKEVEELVELIQWIRTNFDLTILLIEHQMKLVMGLCERIQVMDFGQVIASGTPSEIQNNPKVIEAYLGEEE